MLIELSLANNDWNKCTEHFGNILIDLEDIHKMKDQKDLLCNARGWNQIKIILKNKKKYYVYGELNKLIKKINEQKTQICSYTF